jgi:hypothetical protein
VICYGGHSDRDFDGLVFGLLVVELQS